MKNIIVFGIGKFFKDREEYIKENYKITAFLDNKIQENQTEKYEEDEILIYHPNQVNQLVFDEILIMSRFYVVMCKQLIELGVDEDKIKLGILIQPKNENYKNILDENGRFLVNRGRLVYKSDTVCEMNIDCESDFEEYVLQVARSKRREKKPFISLISQMSTEPASSQFGAERGKPIDRIYIEKFLEENKCVIKGKCLEIAEDTYTQKYGTEIESYILHIEGWGKNAIKGNLETGEGIKENFFDCAIITQTLMFTYKLENVAKSIYKMLKRGGTALITVSGISPISRYDAENWGSYFNFHTDAMKKLFYPLFGENNVEIKSFGNVKTAIAILYGLCYEDLKQSDFVVNDDLYPVIITVKVKKEN